MDTLLIILILLLGAFLGWAFGITGAKIKKSILERTIVKNAKKVIDGDKKNQTLDENGKLYEVDRFKVRNEKDEEILIDLSGNKVDELKKEKISLLPTIKNKPKIKDILKGLFKRKKDGNNKKTIWKVKSIR